MWKPPPRRRAEISATSTWIAGAPAGRGFGGRGRAAQLLVGFLLLGPDEVEQETADSLGKINLDRRSARAVLPARLSA